MKKVLLTISLILLVILLFVPFVLQNYFSDLYSETKVDKKKDIIQMFNCIRENETINTAFFNGKVYSLEYIIRGNYAMNEELGDEAEIVENVNFLNILKKNTVGIYNAEKDYTSFKIIMDSNNTISSDLNNLVNNIDNNGNYYKNIGYSCTVTSNT